MAELSTDSAEKTGEIEEVLADALVGAMVNEDEILAEVDIAKKFAEDWAIKAVRKDSYWKLAWTDDEGRHEGVYNADEGFFITDIGLLDEVEFYAMWEGLTTRKDALIAMGTDPTLRRDDGREPENMDENKQQRGDNQESEEQEKVIPKVVASELLPSGTLLEALYDPERDQSALAIRKSNGKVKHRKSLLVEKEIAGKTCKVLYVPAQNELIKRGTVLLPSRIGQLRDEDELIGYIQGFIHAHVDVDETFERIASYYVLFTWLYDSFTALPYLRALGQHGTGKSRFLKTVGSICYRPVFMGGAVSCASIFRMLELYGGTLLIDEADYSPQSERWALMLQILNLGYEADAAVIRCASSGFNPQPYSCYGPKLIAGRKPFGDKALDSRCLTETFYPTQREDIPLQIPRLIEWEDARKIRNMLLAWRLDKYNPDREHLGYLTGKLEPRLEQIIRPLQAVLTDEEAKEDIEQFVKSYASRAQAERAQTLDGLILRAVVELLEEGQEPYYYAIADKTQPWLENPDYTLTGRKVGIVVRGQLHLESDTGTQNRAKVKINPDAIAHIVKLCPRYGLDGSELRSGLGSVRFGENLTRNQLGC